MNDRQARAWLALKRAPHLTNRELITLMQSTSCADDIWALDTFEMDSLEINPRAQAALGIKANRQCLDSDWRTFCECNIQLVPITSPLYPALLQEIHDPPALLFVRGQVELLNQPQLAMVGSRSTSSAGRENAFRFARELSAAGFTITSGMALGIDAASHEGALAANGATIAVLGTGVDVVYPRRNYQLYNRLLQAGVVVSELPPGARPLRSHFPARNRLISGMSLGVLVVEAALMSGSLITARCAIDQNREVFALPGSIHSANSRGCHQLIQQGACLVQAASDIMQQLQGWLPTGRSVSPVQTAVELSSQERALLTIMGFDPAPIDQLQLLSGWPLPELTSVLMALELKGTVSCQAGNYQQKELSSEG